VCIPIGNAACSPAAVLPVCFCSPLHVACRQRRRLVSGYRLLPAPLQEIVEEDLSALEESSKAVLAHPAVPGSGPQAQPAAAPEAAIAGGRAMQRGRCSLLAARQAGLANRGHTLNNSGVLPPLQLWQHCAVSTTASNSFNLRAVRPA
jgi:hypothetical protein